MVTIEETRQRLLKSIEKTGLRSQSTIEISQELDKLILEVQKAKRRQTHIIMHPRNEVM